MSPQAEGRPTRPIPRDAIRRVLVRLRPPGALGAASGPGLARRAGEALPPVWALRVRLEPVAGPPIDAWRAELRSRVDAAARETRTERAP